MQEDFRLPSGLGTKQAHVDGEDLVERLLAEVRVLQRDSLKYALPSATCSRFRRAA